MQINTVYSYLREKYNDNEPIFLSEIKVPGMKPVSLRQQLKKLTEEGILKRFSAGVYYFPRKTFFKSGSGILVDEVIRKKFLFDGSDRCGYVSGIMFANWLELTTQVPAVYEVVSNKATTDYRIVRLGNYRVIVRRPYVTINSDNYIALQFLDFMRDVTDISEVEGDELKTRLLSYIMSNNMSFDFFKPYIAFYPDRIFKNMYEVGLLHGSFT